MGRKRGLCSHFSERSNMLRQEDYPGFQERARDGDPVRVELGNGIRQLGTPGCRKEQAMGPGVGIGGPELRGEADGLPSTHCSS